MISRFFNPEAELFRLSWAGYAKDRPKPNSENGMNQLSPTVAWRRHHWLILLAWKGLMRAVLRPGAWELLSALLERQELLRGIWLRAGGYLITQSGTKRRKPGGRKGLTRPNPRTLNTELKRAEETYHLALSAEPGFSDVLQVVLLSLSGAISGAQPSSVMLRPIRLRRQFLRIGQSDDWPWPRTLGNRLRDLHSVGLLSRPDDRRLG